MPAWRDAGFLWQVQKSSGMHQLCLGSSQQGCCQLQLPGDCPGLSFCHLELVEAVDEVAGRKDVFPHLSLTSASACSLLLAAAAAFSEEDFELVNFSAVGQREVLAESQIEPESPQIEQMVLLLVVPFARGCLA